MELINNYLQELLYTTLFIVILVLITAGWAKYKDWRDKDLEILIDGKFSSDPNKHFKEWKTNAIWLSIYMVFMSLVIYTSQYITCLIFGLDTDLAKTPGAVADIKNLYATWRGWLMLVCYLALSFAMVMLLVVLAGKLKELVDSVKRRFVPRESSSVSPHD